MKRLLVMLLPVLLLIGCGQKEQSEPDKEVSGGMENQEVVLTVEPIQEPEQIKFNMSLENQGENAVDFQFSTGQKFELVVYDSEHKERYRYSKDKMFTQAFQNLTLEPGETYDFSDEWKEVPEPGTYEVKVTFKGKAEHLKQIQAVQQFEVK
ncbi:BsuPI-related putative proteinase inhibitor [Bacillus atrophaeus]|uniref:BsuPI-related putative proteinase inhibitor n=1 Tax=Bacillus atrophaeus TaxID=1452 RepID=UPI0028808B41|nr:BsuPI-related putative proteinase inhibitor [Bacillus atrophaeus]